MSENKIQNILIGILFILVISLGYYQLNVTKGHYSFYVDKSGQTVEIGQYSSYRICVDDEYGYNRFTLNDQTFSRALTTCEWKK